MITGVVKSGFVYNTDDVNVKDEAGNTALFYAAQNCNQQFVDYLLKLGANPNIMCHHNSPFHLAFKSGNIDVIIFQHSKRLFLA